MKGKLQPGMGHIMLAFPRHYVGGGGGCAPAGVSSGLGTADSIFFFIMLTRSGLLASKNSGDDNHSVPSREIVPVFIHPSGKACMIFLYNSLRWLWSDTTSFEFSRWLEQIQYEK
jgi:hypothetical protein